ncbi:MAG: MFS transporter [Candidatus Hodarchaeota archaeon]
MEEVNEKNKKKTFSSLFRLYFMIYFCFGILPVNLENLLALLPGTTKIGIGIAIAISLFAGMCGMITFGYLGDKITAKISRKKLFIITNLSWILSYGLIAFSLNYNFYLVFFITASFGTGAFLPIGFSIISDLFPPQNRGNKYGAMQFSLALGSGMGIILGGLIGTYLSFYGWRIAYGIGAIFGFLVLLTYIFKAIDPERGSAEPEFENFKGDFSYNYKLTLKSVFQLFKIKSVMALLVYILFYGVAGSTLGNWGIFYLTSKINDPNAGLYGTTLYLLAGLGILFGTIIGGKLGDLYYNQGKVKGRMIISITGLIIGVTLIIVFYLLPFFIDNTLQIVLSWVFFITIGLVGYTFSSFYSGNQFAIYSEVCVPELRSSTNALNGVMVNIGGIIGNLLLSSLIERDISFLPLSILIILLVWLSGVSFWIITYIYYPRELKECREILASRKIEIEEGKNKKSL